MQDVLNQSPTMVSTENIGIRNDGTLGRYLVTSRKKLARDVLIEELPFALGPKLNSSVICLSCYCKVSCSVEGSRCPKCKWPLCENCKYNGKSGHHDSMECEVFQKAKVKFQNAASDENGCPQLDCITTLRVLLAKEKDPTRWEKEVAPMEYHDDARRESSDIWNADLVNISNYLRGPCKLTRFSEDLIMQVVGILEVNAFEARTLEGYPLRCLYPITGILAHSCVPNTARSIYPSEGFRIRLRAMVDLEQGQQLNHSYTYTLNGTAVRQADIKLGKYFTCRCARCSDPTELGTHFSSFKCSKCDSGLLVTSNPLDTSADWPCSNCEFKTSGQAAQKALSVMQSEVDDVQALEMSAERLEHTERLFKKFRSVVHPNHYIQNTLRQSLIEMYGRVDGYGMAELPDVLLEHKQELCEAVLRVLDVFEPGLSRARAMILYELHVPLVLLAKSGFISGMLNGSALRDKLQKAVDILEECVGVLQYEDATSQEGVLCEVARKASEQLKISIDNL